MSCNALEAPLLCSVRAKSYFEIVLTGYFPRSLHSAGEKWEFSDKALIMYIIANLFFASQCRLHEQIPPV